MDEPNDNKYFRHKRKQWARRLNENCENKDDNDFREWDADDLFPKDGWDVRAHCCYDGRVDWKVCESCKQILKKYHVWLSQRNDYIDGLGEEIRQLRKEIRLLRDLISVPEEGYEA